MMARGWMGAVAVCVLALGALTMAGAKPGTVTPVPLDVEFDDSPGRRITSDGQGPYSDGVDGVAAQIDQYGNVILNFQTTQSAMRKVHFDYSDPLDATGAPPDEDGDNIIAPPNSYLATLPGNGQKLQNMAVGSSQCLEAGFSFTIEDASRTQYRNSFHRNLGANIDFTNTSYLVATRTLPTEWELEPKATPCQNVIDVIKLVETPTRGKFNFTDDGRYYMSMKITLKEKGTP